MNTNIIDEFSKLISFIQYKLKEHKEDGNKKQVMSNNNYLYNNYFSNIYKRDELFNIFSNFNKEISFINVLNNLNSNSKNYLILKLNSKDIETIDNININIDKSKNIILKNFNFNIDSQDLINDYYDKYKNIINFSVKDKDEFNEKIISVYNQTLFLSKKKELSSLLVKFHEEIKFKLSIIHKILN